LFITETPLLFFDRQCELLYRMFARKQRGELKDK
jgi:hypothetical protein